VKKFQSQLDENYSVPHYNMFTIFFLVFRTLKNQLRNDFHIIRPLEKYMKSKDFRDGAENLFFSSIYNIILFASRWNIAPIR
jgi:hypothetical protein